MESEMVQTLNPKQIQNPKLKKVYGFEFGAFDI
jgi:hypothetical protein